MTESFDDAMAFARKISDCEFGERPSDSIREWCEMHDCGTCTACLNKLLDRLQDAHDYELEQLRKSRFHEGYVAGQHSMDAEHYAVALRLRALPLDGDTQENLAQIARAVWHSDFGWTQGACRALRDELVRLLGGWSDEPHPNLCRTSAEPDAGAIRQYDVLGNERHEVVCELRKMRSCKEDHFEPELFFDGLYDALGCRAETDGDSGDQMCDRLIHLLGGDEPTESLGSYLSRKSVDAMSMRAESDESGEVTITAELRKWASDNTIKDMVLTTYPEQHGVHGILEQLIAIADRIDEQFDRICQQQEAVLQSTIDGAGHRLKDADKQRDELRRSLRQIAERAGVPHDRDLSEYSDEKVANAIIGQLGNTNQYVKSLEWVRDRRLPRIEAERDELQAKLDRVAAALRVVERGTMSAWEAADEVGR